MTQTLPLTIALGAAYTGQAIGYRVLNLDRTVYSAFSTTNVAETAIAGTYAVSGGILVPDAGGYVIVGTALVDYAEAAADAASSLVSVSGTGLTTIYGTVARLRAEHLTQVASGATNDALLSQMLVSATAFVNSALGFAFNGFAAAAEKKFHRDASRLWLSLPYYESGTLTALARDDTDFASDEYEIDSDDHTQLYNDDGWPAGRYAATAAWGYGTVPEEIVKVTMQIASDLWTGRDVRSQANAAGVEGPGQVIVQRALTWQQYNIVQETRRKYGVMGVA